MAVFAQPAGAFKPSSPLPLWVSRFELQPFQNSCGLPFSRYLLKRHKSTIATRPCADNSKCIDLDQPHRYYRSRYFSPSSAQYSNSYGNIGRRIPSVVGSYGGHVVREVGEAMGQAHNHSNPGALPSDMLPKSTKKNWLSAGERNKRSLTVASLVKIGEVNDVASRLHKENMSVVLEDSENGKVDSNSIFNNDLCSLELSNSDRETTNILPSNGCDFSYYSGLSSHVAVGVTSSLNKVIDVPNTSKHASRMGENGATRNATRNETLLGKHSSTGEHKELFEVTTGFEVVNKHDIVLMQQEGQIEHQQNLRSELCRMYDKVLVVDNIPDAKRVVRLLTSQYKQLVHACDTEVSKIDVKQETPVDHGEITCFSIYCGEEADFGNGKSCVWVDVLDGGGKDLLLEFAPFFEDPSIKKVWHNYSFDCHVIENYGIKVSGFHADTMHMARLWDSSRRLEGGYSLEALTSDPKIIARSKLHRDEYLAGKVSMKALFGRRNAKKDGSLGKIITIPPIEELQREDRKPWICYSSLDSISTLRLYESMKCKLEKMPWKVDGTHKGSMINFYEHYWRPFGKLMLDAKMEEEAEKEQGGPGKKRVRVARSSKAKCQVPQCETDISELKGYHRRHRVCLQCANAKSVMLSGENKRYCQQCGKFHVLSDFDEGKRSCRRKLERHNKRRRRKAVDSGGSADKELQLDLQGEDVSSDGEDGKGDLSLSTHNPEGDNSKGPEDENRSNSYSAPDCQIINSDSATTFTASGETQVDGGKDDSTYDVPPYNENKNIYTSACPTGRISFKLYDWNPAEFPRRLRLQIFQWLASMPVELEGYIRPGCIILTAFISMPVPMWMKLLDNPASYVQDFLSPGRVLSRKGATLVYLNNMIFRVLQDGTSVMKANVAKRAPQLHYVYPSFFEAGKPMEINVCGSNIFQPNFRSLVSFAGKYVDHTYNIAFPHDTLDGEGSVSFDHQLCRILVPHTEANVYGPAFVEVENEFGLSNFIPIIIGNEELCSEMKMMQQKHVHEKQDNTLHGTCRAFCTTQSTFSDFLLDVAWLLKQPVAEKLQYAITSSQIKRVACLLNFLVRNQSVHILGRILESAATIVDDIAENNANGVADADRRFLQEHIAQARCFYRQTLVKAEDQWHIKNLLRNDSGFSRIIPSSDAVSIVPIEVQDVRIRAEGNVMTPECSTSALEDETVWLLNGEVAMDVVDTKQYTRKSCNPVMTNRIIKSRPSLLIMTAIAICFGVCTVLLHPAPVHRIAVSIRRCLFNDTQL